MKQAFQKKYVVSFLAILLVGCAPYASTDKTFLIKTIDRDTKQPVPYAVLKYSASVAKGGGSIDNAAPKTEQYGKGRFIFTDEKGEAKVKAIPIVGMGNYSQGISGGFSDRYIFGLPDWGDTNKLSNNDKFLNPGSSTEKTILMSRMDNFSLLSSHIKTYFYLEIETNKSVIMPGQEKMFCDFIRALKRNGHFDLDDIFIGTNRSFFEESKNFKKHMAQCGSGS